MNKQPAPAPDARIRFHITDEISPFQVSECIVELLGFSVDDFYSGAVSFVDRIHADDQDIARAVFAPQTTDAALTCNLRLRQASGRIRCLKATYQRHPSTDGSGFDLELLLQDARSLVRTMEDPSAMVNFRAMMEATDDYIYFKDRNHVFTGASQTLVALCDPAEHWTDLLGTTDYDVFPEEFADIYYRLEKQVFAGVSVAHEIQKTLTKDGRSGWVDNRKYPIRDAGGEIIGLYGIARDITDRVLNEEALLRSEKKFRTLYATMTEGVALHEMVFDRSGRPADYILTDVNPAFESILGMRREDVLGRKASELYGQIPYLDLYADVATTGKPRHFEANFEPLKKVFSISAFSPDKGQFATVFDDITERRTAEETLRLQSDILASMAEGVHLVRASDGVIVFATPQLEGMFGYEAGELIGKHVSAINPPDEIGVTTIANEIVAMLEQSGAWSGEVKNIRKDASEFWCHASVTTYEHPKHGQVWVSVHEDVTRQKLDAEKIRKLSLAVEQSPESIAITNLDAKIEYVNDAFVKATGYSREEAIGQNPRVLHSGKTPPETYAAMWATLTQGLPWAGEFFNRRKDGSEYTELASISPLRNTDGHVTHYVAVKEDITQRKQNAEELERHRDHLEELVSSRTLDLSIAKEAAEAASRAKSAFLATMSHELRTPMNGIMGMTDLALRRATDPKQQEYLGRAAQASKHLLAILNDILDMAKIEAGRFELNLNEFNVASLVNDLTDLVSPLAVQKGLKLKVGIDPRVTDMCLQGDVMRVRQILLNLVGNAIKFTAEGSVGLQARVAEESAEQVVLHFSVSDSGIGISADDQKRLFTPFQQVDSSLTRSFGGTGLGLAISKRLVEAMGGTMGIESQVGDGSSFWFTVRLDKNAPALASTPPISTNEGALSAETALKTRFAGARILLVEDEPISQEVARFLLENVGLDVDVADDGEQAVEKVTQHDYDLVLMDMQMPNMNGLDATRAIRAMPARETLPIVAMTANAFDEDRQRCLATGMTDFMAKPVNPAVLFETVLRGLQWSGS